MPLIELPAADIETVDNDQTMLEVSNRVVHALQTSGFLLVKSHHLPLDLQQRALETTRQIFRSDDTATSIVQHPTDPKRYLMIDCHSSESMDKDLPASLASPSQAATLVAYADALELVKMKLLQCIALGLSLPKDFFVKLHQGRNSALRLLHYPSAKTQSPGFFMEPTMEAGSAQLPIIRCKAHSDYGSCTLLLTDGVPGLQAFVHGEWKDVPHVEGALVVNVGSLLSEWTKGKLLATLHRVVLAVDVDDKDHAASKGNSRPTSRTSLAYFADPDPDVSARVVAEQNIAVSNEGVSVAEYIQWRSGGTDANRSGVAFSDDEAGRIGSALTEEEYS